MLQKSHASWELISDKLGDKTTSTGCVYAVLSSDDYSTKREGMRFLVRLQRSSALLMHIFRGMRTSGQFKQHQDHDIPDVEFQETQRLWLKQLSEKLPLKITVHGEIHDEPALWVANHVSWMDIPVIGGVAPVGFLSKSEVASWPLIGKLAKSVGTLFIRRGNSRAAQEAIDLLKTHLSKNHSVLFFPEGTTTDGSYLRRFHARLLAAAIDLGIPIQPVALKYTDQSGELCKASPFIDDMTFGGHFWQLIGSNAINVEVSILARVPTTPDVPRKELSQQLETAIGESLSIIEH